jgi:hypothetical protein
MIERQNHSVFLRRKDNRIASAMLHHDERDRQLEVLRQLTSSSKGDQTYYDDPLESIICINLKISAEDPTLGVVGEACVYWATQNLALLSIATSC